MVREAIILAAGEGTRLRPFTEDMPKVMLPVANKPILEYVVEALAENGVSNIIMVVGYKKESIMNYFGEGKKWDANIIYAMQEKQLGTGHALLQAEEHVNGEEILVLPGDNIIDKNSISKLISSDAPSLIVEESELPSKYGVVEMEDDTVVRLIEKPEKAESNLISTGIYKLRKDIFKILRENVERGKNKLTDAIQFFVESGELKGIKVDGHWKDIIYPWNLLEVNSGGLYNLPSSISGKIEKNVFIKGKVVIGEGSVIHSGSYIEGPVIIGKGCEIGPNACIFPSTSIGDNVMIHPFSEIRNSIIMDNATIGSCSFISNSVVGKSNSISSHFSTITGNARIEVDGELHKIERIGAFVGSDCEIGANVVVEPGKRIGKKCIISSNKLIKDDIPNGSRVV